MISSLLASGVRLFTGAQAVWTGCEPLLDRQRIYFANHTSNLDFLLLWSSLPTPLRRRTRPVAAQDYWSAGPTRQRVAEGLFHAVLIDRRKVTRANHPVERLLEVMKNGDSLIIFPEGTRRNDAGVGEFKSGLYHLAKARPDVECVPVHIDNLNRVLPKGEVLPVPLLCSVTFGAPIALGAEESKPLFLARARQAVVDLAPPP